MIALASLTGSFITLLGFLGGAVAFVSLLRNPPETLPKEGVWLSLTFAGYFAVLAITTTLNGPDPERFIEFVIISPFIYFIPLALILPVRCTDISMKGLGRAAMIGTVPAGVLAFFTGEFFTGTQQATLAAGNPNVLASLLLLQSFLCFAGWANAGPREKLVALVCASIGLTGLVLGVASRGANLSAIILALICFCFWCSCQPRLARRIMFTALASGLLAGAFITAPTFRESLTEIFGQLTDPEFGDWSTSAWERLTMYRAATLVIIDNPWSGLGLHLRSEGIATYYAVQPPDIKSFQYTHVHNLLLTHGTAAGIPGILAALSLFATVLFTSFQQNHTMVRWLGVISTFELFLLGLTETVLFHDLNTTFFAFLFIQVAVFSHQAHRINIEKDEA